MRKRKEDEEEENEENVIGSSEAKIEKRLKAIKSQITPHSR